MSGSEIIEEIKKETGGRWKPSPGSVYPLLAWLQDNGYTKELPKEEGGVKRYILTEKGEKFLDKQAKSGGKLWEKLGFLSPLPFGGLGFFPQSKKLREIKEPVRRFAMALLNLRMVLEENLTEQTIKDLGELLTETTEKLEKITERIKRR